MRWSPTTATRESSVQPTLESKSEGQLVRTSLTLISPRYYTQNLDGIMSLINEKATDLRAAKFLAAAQYGSIARDVAKCEHRYQCAMDLEIIKTVF